MVQLQHEGQLERLQQYWLAGACKKTDDEGESSQPLGILNFTSAFILLAVGMMLGGLLLLMEHCYFKFFRSRLRKWDKCGCCGLVSMSMGRSLTFEQSVREAIDMQRHHKCENPICETNTWKLKHELDLALLRIDRLHRQMGDAGLATDHMPVTAWQNHQHSEKWPPPSPPGIMWCPGDNSGDLGPIIKSGFSGAQTQHEYPPWNYDDSLEILPKENSASDKKSSKSLPTSPTKKSLLSKPAHVYTLGNFGREQSKGRPNMGNVTSVPDANERTVRHNRGNVYIPVDNKKCEIQKETVL